MLRSLSYASVPTLKLIRRLTMRVLAVFALLAMAVVSIALGRVGLTCPSILKALGFNWRFDFTQLMLS